MDLKELLDKAKNTRMTDAELEAQRISFAYGNSHFENEQITRDTVRRESEKLKAEECDEKEG